MFDVDTTLMDVRSIVDQVKWYGDNFDLVVLTGGEPFRQNFIPLVEVLNHNGYRVQVETAGTLWLADALRQFRPGNDPSKRNTIVCSPKTGSLNPAIVPYIDAYKYIINEEDYSVDVGDDGLPVMSTQVPGERLKLARPHPSFPRAKIYLQPCFHYLDYTDDCDYVADEEKNSTNRELATSLALMHGYTLCLQVHKLVGLP